MPLLTQQQSPERSRWRSLPGPSTSCSWGCPVSPCQQHHHHQSTPSSSPINIIMATACLLSQGCPVSPCQQHHHHQRSTSWLQLVFYHRGAQCHPVSNIIIINDQHHGNSLSSITGMFNVTLSSIIINNNHCNAKSLSSITGVSSVTLSSSVSPQQLVHLDGMQSGCNATGSRECSQAK